jgi:hypothetical protein
MREALQHFDGGANLFFLVFHCSSHDVLWDGAIIGGIVTNIAAKVLRFGSNRQISHGKPRCFARSSRGCLSLARSQGELVDRAEAVLVPAVGSAGTAGGAALAEAAGLGAPGAGADAGWSDVAAVWPDVTAWSRSLFL